MFCQKCGAKNESDADFCQKCGERFVKGNSTTPPADNQGARTKKKKSKKKLFGFGAIAALIIIIIIAINSGGGGGTDYVATVKAWEPFANSQGLPGAYGTVLSKYINNCEWQADMVSDNKAEILTRGTVIIDGISHNFWVVASVTRTGDSASMKILSGSIDEEPLTVNEATEFVLIMFSAYNGGFATLDDYAKSQAG